MDAIDILHSDHQQFLVYFDQIEKANDEDHKELDHAFKALEEIITVHMESEEEIFYPEAMKVAELQTMIEKSYQSHHLVDIGLKELHLVPYGFDSWKPKFRAIRDSIVQHMTEEEQWLFPKIRELLPAEQLKAIGEEIMQLRESV